jgi:hypothetical protein
MNMLSPARQRNASVRSVLGEGSGDSAEEVVYLVIETQERPSGVSGRFGIDDEVVMFFRSKVWIAPTDRHVVMIGRT